MIGLYSQPTAWRIVINVDWQRGDEAESTTSCGSRAPYTYPDTCAISSTIWLVGRTSGRWNLQIFRINAPLPSRRGLPGRPFPPIFVPLKPMRSIFPSSRRFSLFAGIVNRESDARRPSVNCQNGLRSAIQAAGAFLTSGFCQVPSGAMIASACFGPQLPRL